MSRIDYVTAIVVTICFVALVFLIYFASKINDPLPGAPPEVLPTEEAIQDTPPPLKNQNTVDNSLTIKDEEKDPNSSPTEAVPEEASPSSTPEPTAPSGSNTGGATGKYLVVAGSLNQESLAQKEVDRLKKLGYSAAAIGLFNGGKIFSPIAGRFDNSGDAQKLVRELKTKHKIDAYVHLKR